MKKSYEKPGFAKAGPTLQQLAAVPTSSFPPP